MLTIVAGHVRSVVHDWAEANFRLGDEAYVLTVHPDPAGEAPNATRSAGINKELRSVVAGRDVVVVLDARGGDGPRVGLHDPKGRFSDATITEGRGFQGRDFEAAGTSVGIVRSGSYLVGREGRFIPDSVRVVGYFEPGSVPFTSEYVYTLFSQENVHGTYYLEAADPGLVKRFEAALERGGYVVSTERLEADAAAILRGEPLTYAYAASLLLVYGSAVLFSLNWAASNERRYRIERLYGARPLTFTARALRPVAVAAVVGTAMGAAVGMLVLRGLGALSRPPGLADAAGVVVANGAIMPCLFVASVAARTARWERR